MTKTNFEFIVDEYLKNQSQAAHFSYEIKNKNVLFDDIEDVVKVNIYRILQEAIQNIISDEEIERAIEPFISDEFKAAQKI